MRRNRNSRHSPNAFVDFRQMRIHSINKRLGKFADARFWLEEIPRNLLFFPGYRRAACHAEMILPALLARSRAAHCYVGCGKVRHHIGDFDRRAGGSVPD